MANPIRRFIFWLRQGAHHDALDEEIEFHRTMKEQELEAGGLARDDARLAARRAMGHLTHAREDARAVWIWPWLESVWQDTAYAVRSLPREPGFTLLSVVILGVVLVGSSHAVAIGSAVGILGAVGASQILRESLYGLSPLDPLAYAGVAVLLGAAALTASYIPARRATRIDATQALREG